jgi:thiamine-phosphate pyrophosphorylase
MRIERLQYLTHDIPGRPHWKLAEEACAAGVRWVQMRSKLLTGDELLSEAKRVVGVCRTFHATVVINDHPDIALAAGADGVHLGKEDLPLSQARRQTSDGFIIGGTVNTVEDVIEAARNGADYVGLGPFRFTGTKNKLAPVLGIEGCTRIMYQVRNAGVNIPVIAIGGILPEDVQFLLREGISGVAVASALHDAPDMKAGAEAFIQQILQYS